MFGITRRCSKQSRFRRRALPILPPSPLTATAHLQPLAQPTALRHPGSRCDIDSHPDCRPFLTLIVAPQQILNLLEELKERLHLSYLFIAHDLSVIHHVSDRIAVMYLGKIVELAESETLYQTPRHPYTEALISAIPAPDPEIKPNHILLSGEVADPSNPPPGCAFHPRCQYAVEKCRVEEPPFTALSDTETRFVSCHRAHELALKPAAHQHLASRHRTLDVAALRI